MFSFLALVFEVIARLEDLEVFEWIICLFVSLCKWNLSILLFEYARGFGVVGVSYVVYIALYTYTSTSMRVIRYEVVFSQGWK